MSTQPTKKSVSTPQTLQTQPAQPTLQQVQPLQTTQQPQQPTTHFNPLIRSNHYVINFYISLCDYLHFVCTIIEIIS